MASLEPFAGLRPPASLVGKVACPPYDVVNAAEARAYASGNAQSFFHVSRPEIDLPESVDEHADAVYRRGAENLGHFKTQGWLTADVAPRFYLYRQKMGPHSQVGLVAAASVAEYDDGRIRRHELTRADKEDDRTRHIDALGGNDEPVFLTYRASPAIDALIDRGVRLPPAYDFVSEDGIAHTFWIAPAETTDSIRAAFREVPRLYIADGHHRSAAASRVHALRKGRNSPGHHDRFLAVVFPDNQMQILDYNRVVRDLRGLSPADLVERLRQKFGVEPTAETKPSQVHQFGMFVGGSWYRLQALPGTFPETPLGVLDVNILQQNVLGPVLGIGDPRTDPRLAFVGGIRGTAELERVVGSGQFAVAFSMFPTTMGQLLAIADANEIMPPKSTWFEPKLRSGLVLHPF
jgi:uncharacterized protein (DUF1015 family)